MNAGRWQSGRCLGGGVPRAGAEVKVVWFGSSSLHLLTCEYSGNIHYIHTRTSSDQGPRSQPQPESHSKSTIAIPNITSYSNAKQFVTESINE